MVPPGPGILWAKPPHVTTKTTFKMLTQFYDQWKFNSSNINSYELTLIQIWIYKLDLKNESQIRPWRVLFLVTSSILAVLQWSTWLKEKISRWYVPSTQKARISWISKEFFSYWVSPVTLSLSSWTPLLSISEVYLRWEEHTFRVK